MYLNRWKITLPVFSTSKRHHPEMKNPGGHSAFSFAVCAGKRLKLVSQPIVQYTGRYCSVQRSSNSPAACGIHVRWSVIGLTHFTLLCTTFSATRVCVSYQLGFLVVELLCMSVPMPLISHLWFVMCAVVVHIRTVYCLNYFSFDVMTNKVKSLLHLD